ncbi:hypothetical protein OAA99_02490 [Omnitrophica bacterium]|nr:hypothetical protein [Candidatus Omnitrophota bacterium]
MDLPFLYIVDGVLMLSIFYACFCAKTPEEKEINIHTPLKNENYLNYEECEEFENDEISALV